MVFLEDLAELMNKQLPVKMDIDWYRVLARITKGKFFEISSRDILRSKMWNCSVVDTGQFSPYPLFLVLWIAPPETCNQAPRALLKSYSDHVG